VKPHTKTLSPVSPERKVGDTPTFSVGAFLSENIGFHSVQKNGFDKLAPLEASVFPVRKPLLESIRLKEKLVFPVELSNGVFLNG
jgi:hypothetical protein